MSSNGILNLRGGWALVQGTWLSWLQHRSFFFLLAFGWMVPPLIYLFVWASAAGGGAIGGLNRDDFVVYYLVLALVNQLTYAQTNWTVGDVIRAGSFNRLLLYPMPPIFDTIAAEVAGKVVMMSFVVPVTLLLGLLLRPGVSIDAAGAVLFLPALLLAWALRFFWGYWLALLAFWLTRADALLAVQDGLIFVLAGQAAPLAVLPGYLRAAAVWLPFRYMIGFPVEVLLGQLDGAGLRQGFALQLSWVVVAVLLYRLAWRRGLRRYEAVGG